MNKDILIALLYLMSTFSFGQIFLQRTYRDKDITKLALIIFSFVIGIPVSALLIFFSSYIMPIRISSVLFTLTGLFLLAFFLKQKLLVFKDIEVNKSLLTFNIFWFVVFSLVIWKTHLSPNNLFLNGSPSTFGDLPFHLGIITNFAYGNNFPPINPIFSSSNLSYHFIADLVSGILISLGSSLRGSIIYPSIFLGMLIINSMYILVMKMLNKNVIAFLSIYLFMFNGGLTFLKPFFDKLPLVSLFNGTIRYAHVATMGVDYPNILSEILMAERALFMGIPLWVASIYFIYLWYMNSKRSFLLISGLIIGILPYANIYAILVNVFFVFVLAVYKFLIKKEKIDFTGWIYFLAIIFIISLPIVVNMLASVVGESNFIRISLFEWPPMNMMDKRWFWLNNFGVSFVLFLMSLPFVCYKIKKNYLFIILLSFLIFIAHVIVFQPYAWDNNRFIIYPYFGICILASYLIEKLLISNKLLIKMTGLVIFITAILSGLLVTINDTQMSYPLFSNKDLERTEAIVNSTDAHGVFLTARNHNNIISSLYGRRLLLGYGGFLWTHGISNTGKIEKESNEIYSGFDLDNNVLKNKIRYILISDWERSEYKMLNESYLTSYYGTTYQDDSIKILDTKLKLNPTKYVNP